MFEVGALDFLLAEHGSVDNFFKNFHLLFHVLKLEESHFDLLVFAA